MSAGGRCGVATTASGCKAAAAPKDQAKCDLRAPDVESRLSMSAKPVQGVERLLDAVGAEKDAQPGADGGARIVTSTPARFASL
ncbi:hypothetical protein Pla175_26680 [Pirellulimonas nuda]|uniref:Uncharacterized protein n=1 Tax=Pirellulimonas nuda TaxID=2528009 RepID=A0A518DCT6_9BACT|nr:hypothetical protein Pla175_26680 [Pirellulimonas nuda]